MLLYLHNGHTQTLTHSQIRSIVSNRKGMQEETVLLWQQETTGTYKFTLEHIRIMHQHPTIQ